MGRPDALARDRAATVSLFQPQLRPLAVGVLGILLWLLESARLLARIHATPWHAPTCASTALVAAICLLVLPDLSHSLRAPLTLAIAILGVLMLRSWQPDWVREALRFAGPFAAFLMSIALLRTGLLSPARLAAARARLAAHDETGRRAVLLLLSCLLGGVFSIGGLPLLAPLAKGSPPSETDRQAAAILCGNALALLWSPFTIGMGFAASAVGIEGGFAFMPRLLMAAAAGLVIALAVHGWPGRGAMADAVRTAWPLLPPFAAAVAITLAIATFAHLRVTDAVVLMAPLAGLAGLARALRRRRPYGGAGPVLARLPGPLLQQASVSVRDLPMYVAGFALAKALAGSGLFALPPGLLGAAGQGAALLLPLLGLAMALLGLPVLVSGGVIAAASMTLLPNAAPGTWLTLTLYAWLATSLVSATGMTVLTAASTFGTRVSRLVLGRNLLVAGLLGLVLALLTLLTR